MSRLRLCKVRVLKYNAKIKHIYWTGSNSACVIRMEKYTVVIIDNKQLANHCQIPKCYTPSLQYIYSHIISSKDIIKWNCVALQSYNPLPPTPNFIKGFPPSSWLTSATGRTGVTVLEADNTRHEIWNFYRVLTPLSRTLDIAPYVW